MALITPNDDHLTVFNLFDAESVQRQDEILDHMRDIIDNAAYPGWISSTLHSGQDRPGTANFIQWRSVADLERRYAGETFQNRTVPRFRELSDSMKLLQTELVFSQRRPDLDRIEISPAEGSYTVLIVMGVRAADQDELLNTLAKPDEWIKQVPGYRSHSIFRALDGSCIVNYAQWDGKDLYDTFHDLAESERPEEVRDGRARARKLLTYRDANSYLVVHTRSAATAVREQP